MVSSTKVDSKVNLIARMPTINRFWSTERVEKPAIIFCKQSEVSTVHCMLRKAMRSLARGNEVPMNSSPSMSMSITCIVLEVSRLANLSQLWFIYPTLLKLQDFKIPNFRTTKTQEYLKLYWHQKHPGPTRLQEASVMKPLPSCFGLASRSRRPDQDVWKCGASGHIVARQLAPQGLFKPEVLQCFKQWAFSNTFLRGECWIIQNRNKYVDMQYMQLIVSNVSNDVNWTDVQVLCIILCIVISESMVSVPTSSPVTAKTHAACLAANSRWSCLQCRR